MVEPLEEGMALPPEPARARASDPDTSHEAAESLSAEILTKLDRAVIEGLRAYDGLATSEQIADATGISLQSVTPRIKPLRQRGLLFDAGFRRTGRSGRSRIVWGLAGEAAVWHCRLTPKALNAWAGATPPKAEET